MMGDTFFGFNAELPAPRLDKRGRLDDLTRDDIEEEEEEYDALNDETFGSGAIDGDWEQAHENLAQLIHKGNRQSSNSSPSHFYFDESVLDGDDSQQEIVQKSISQLGLEDDLDDPAIMTVGRKHFSLHPVQTFFRQSPPPPAILDTECGSPKTHSIWSTTHSTPGKDSGLGSLLQSITRNSSCQSSYQDSSSPITPLSGDVFQSPFQRKAWTVEEVERNLLSTSKSPCSSPSNDWSCNHFVTNDRNKREKEHSNVLNTNRYQNEWMSGSGDHEASEFVRHENLKDRWKVRTPPLPLSSGVRTLDDVEKDILLKPRAQMLDDVERQLQGDVPVNRNVLMETHNMSNHSGLPAPIGAKHRAPIGSKQSSSPPSVATTPLKPPYPLGGLYPPGRARHALLNPRPVGNIYPNMQTGIPWIPAVDPLRMQSAGRRLPGVPPAFRGVPERMQCDPRILNHPFLQRQFINSLVGLEKRMDLFNRRPVPHNVLDGHVDLDQDQEYCGLMSQKEKDWLIKIQMMLLQVDDPYNQDYYYSTYAANKYAKMSKKSHSGEEEEEPTLILPERTKPEVKVYVPAHFEGSLGKLQAVSVNFPRRVIDVAVGRHIEDEEGRTVTNQSLLKYRRLLLDIEKLYTILLEIGDEERRIAALPDDAQIPHKDNIINLTQKIFCGFACEAVSDDTFQNILSVRKGRNLAIRVYRLFTKDQRVCFLEAFFRCFLVILKKDQYEMNLMQNSNMFMGTIKKLTLNELVKLGESLGNLQAPESVIANSCKEKSGFIPAFKNKFGSSLVCSMFRRAEDIYAGFDLLESEMQTRWAKVILHAVDILCTLPDDSVVPPVEPCTDLLVHFQRFAVDRDKFEVLTEKVKIFECDSSVNHSTT